MPQSTVQPPSFVFIQGAGDDAGAGDARYALHLANEERTARMTSDLQECRALRSARPGLRDVRFADTEVRYLSDVPDTIPSVRVDWDRVNEDLDTLIIATPAILRSHRLTLHPSQTVVVRPGGSFYWQATENSVGTWTTELYLSTVLRARLLISSEEELPSRFRELIAADAYQAAEILARGSISSDCGTFERPPPRLVEDDLELLLNHHDVEVRDWAIQGMSSALRTPRGRSR